MIVLPFAFVEMGPYPMIAKSIFGMVAEASGEVQDLGYSASSAAPRWPPDERPQMPKPLLDSLSAAMMFNARLASSTGA
uniref:Uncharacterized protein n=1 Tax=Tanacetum cinerariifolium TaxID=118510 RepID=A0A699UKI2_TANCI|nr:hypothetical protein [Tanacetum cinerariifolium]